MNYIQQLNEVIKRNHAMETARLRMSMNKGKSIWFAYSKVLNRLIGAQVGVEI